MDVIVLPAVPEVGRTLPTGLTPAIGFLVIVVGADLVVELLLATEDEELAFLNIDTVLSCEAVGRGVSPRGAIGLTRCDGIVGFFFTNPGVLLAASFDGSDGPEGRNR